MNRKPVVAIDGPAGSGKSSTAKALAEALGLPYIDTGAMYRAVTLKAIRGRVPFDDKLALAALAAGAKIELRGNPKAQEVYLDGENVSKDIRDPELTKNVFHLAQEPLVRRELVKKQQEMGRAGGAVMDGRDIGTMVFPNADYKFFFTASDDTRAVRRQAELAAAGIQMSVEAVKKDLLARDETDLNRKEGPLRQAPDAMTVDTTSLTIEATIVKMLAIIGPKPL